MKGQIEEQHGDDINTVREAYKNGVNFRPSLDSLYWKQMIIIRLVSVFRNK